MGKGPQASHVGIDALGRNAPAHDSTGDLSAETFQGLVLRLRGRTGLTQGEVATRVGMHAHSIQGWESGANYPGPHSLQALVGAYLDAGGFIPGRETVEAAALWAAALRQAPRFRTPFDPSWFEELLARASVVPGRDGMASARRRQDWGEAPDVSGFHGRAHELETLRRWILTDRCSLVAVLGLGGIGKSTLTARLVEELAPVFERVYWRSLRNAPPAIEWLAGAIGFLSDYRVPAPEGEAARLDLLLEIVRERRCLLVLDNLEAVLQPCERDGQYRAGCASYGVLLERTGAGRHQSAFLLTSREAPLELGPLEGAHAPVRSLTLAGLATDDARALLQHRGLVGDGPTWAALVERYGGNGLALKIAGESIRNLFGGDIASFLKVKHPPFGGIRGVLDEQLARLSDLERAALWWLAIERESRSFHELAADLGSAHDGAAIMEAVDALRRRSLLVGRRVHGQALALQSVVQEYVTDRLAEEVVREIGARRPALLLSHALVTATSKEYVRQSQERLIAAPVLERLTARFGSQAKVEQRLHTLLGCMRTRPAVEQGYGPGNLVNLLRMLRGNLRGVDLSGLAIRQAYLQEVEAQDASLAGAHLSDSILSEGFAYPASIALSADGAYLAAGTGGGEVRVWRVDNRTPILSVQGHTSVVTGVRLSPDGRLLASCSVDGTLKLWEPGTGKCTAMLQTQSNGAWAVALTRAGRLLASGHGDGTVRVWDTANGELLTTIDGHTSPVRAVALSDDGQLLASGSLDGTIKLWDPSTGCHVATPPGHEHGLWAIALSGDGRLLTSGGVDGAVQVWDLDAERLLDPPPGHAGGVLAVALSEDGRLVASGGQDGRVQVSEPATGRSVGILQGHSGVVRTVALSGDGRLLASGSLDGTIRLWDPGTCQHLATLQGQTGAVWGVALGSDGGQLVSGGGDGLVRLWDARGSECLATLRHRAGLVMCVALSGDGRLLASGGQDGAVRLSSFDARPSTFVLQAQDRPTLRESEECLATLRGHVGAVMSVALDRDGRVLASGGLDGTVKVWALGQDQRDGQLVATLPAHAGGVWGVALSHDGRLMATCGVDQTVRLWDSETGRLIQTLHGAGGAVWAVALSGGGQVLASGSLDGAVRLWDVARADCLATLPSHPGGVWSVALSDDGRLAASGGQDGTLRLWDAVRTECLATMAAHVGLVRALALSGDGQVLASGGQDGTLKLWDARTGAVLSTLRGDRCYERMDVAGLTGVTQAQRSTLVALGAVELPIPIASRTFAY